MRSDETRPHERSRWQEKSVGRVEEKSKAVRSSLGAENKRLQCEFVRIPTRTNPRSVRRE